MKLSLLYNWPIGEDSARASLGMGNVEDAKHDFRIGVINKGDDPSGWLVPSWASADEITKLNPIVKRSSAIRVEVRDHDTQEVIGSYEWNCSELWPPEAGGATSVDVGYTF
jgi:hypothetical protein